MWFAGTIVLVGGSGGCGAAVAAGAVGGRGAGGGEGAAGGGSGGQRASGGRGGTLREMDLGDTPKWYDLFLPRVI